MQPIANVAIRGKINSMIRRDPIVEEVRKHRAAIAREHGNDIEAIVAALEREFGGTPTITLPAKRLPSARRLRKPSTTTSRKRTALAKRNR